MDYAALGKHTLTFSSSLFDVASDVINSLNFLGYYNEITNSSEQTLNGSIDTNHSLLYHNASYLSNILTLNEVEETNDVHQIWGVLCMLMIFLPGIIAGSFFVVWLIFECIKERNCEIFLAGIGFLLISIFFPFVFIIMQVATILHVIRKKKIDSSFTFLLVAITNIEASIESVGQLCLQLFTILYGYPSDVIQKITIASSFIQIARCAILNDMEAKLTIEGAKLSFIDSIKETLRRLPTYIATIVFRVSSLVLCMAYLRVYSIGPMVLLILENIIFSWIRFKNNTDYDLAMKIGSGFYLLFTNLGVVNAYSMMSAALFDDNDDRDKIEKEDDNDVINFVRHSSIVTFIHHTLILSSIMVSGWHYPDAFEHWNSPEFLFSPRNRDFYWLFSVVILVGVYSLTVILYRARNITTVEGGKINKIPINQRDENKDVEDGDNEES